jgi:hypothetical protein
MKKNISKSKILKVQLDDALRRAVMNIDNKTPWDNLSGTLQVNHLITRSCEKVRWHPINVFCGTSSANLRHEYQPDHMNLWFVLKYGVGVYSELCNFSHGVAKWTIEELENLLDFWESNICGNTRDKVENGYLLRFNRHNGQELLNEYLKYTGKYI